jgi:hypothetical protein
MHGFRSFGINDIQYVFPKFLRDPTMFAFYLAEAREDLMPGAAPAGVSVNPVVNVQSVDHTPAICTFPGRLR